MTRRAARRKETEILKLVANNQAAMNEGPRRKTFSIQDMHKIEPLTDNQERAFELFDSSNDHGILLEGCPGTGKTFIAIYNSLKLILDKNTPFRKLLIVRAPLAVHSQGFIKGDLDEKQAVYEKPYGPIFDSIFKYKKAYENMKEAGIVEFETVSYLRGVTYDDTILIAEECQNLTYHEGVSLASRLGTNSKFIMCGDSNQSDFKRDSEKSESLNFFRLIKSMPSVDCVKFGPQDIVRSDWCRELIETQIKLGHI